VIDAEEGQGREAGEWGNKVFWKQTMYSNEKNQ
jgi:hypothetical protein